MLRQIISYSVKNRYIVLFFTFLVLLFGLYSLSQIHIGAVPDITNNQVQIITTSKNLSTQDIEQFITYPVELEMANLPGVKELRSVSKFGLSVVTVVFEDNLGTYLPRQLIAEKIKMAAEKIPEGYGTPEMGPVSTGLGEIYQYILDVKPGYENKYDPTSLRTIQDWIVKRQLSGIPGVVEVNSWGGYLKQYEVSINLQKLDAMHLTISDVFDAMQMNNANAGGSYIEKNQTTYFIRAEGLLKSKEDIENLIVKTRGGIPVKIKDFGEVKIGHAPRFGAITGNGEGEKVLGQILMLKDGNSNEVIKAVKERVAQISKTLPEGVYINGFLERSELIAKTTHTITENLILGCLIVIFIVILFLGNWRSGLIVASVIPLSLFFAIALMNLLHVDANLMSLGAIDFGIIIDGAVIIVEYISHKMTSGKISLKSLTKEEQQEQIDEITINSASKMMDSAVFGQLIILIVFIPILSLSGVEGKMFRPMALTFSFAIIGALLMCLTYVPAIVSLVLKPVKAKDTLIDKVFLIINKFYQPTLHYVLHHQKTVIAGSVGLLFLTSLIFLRLGGEFVPTLDEGDFVIQPVIKTGTSLTKTIEITTQIEDILIREFPEVSQVVSRIGAAEIPTDPMSMEESDVIIKLRPKGEWTSATTKDKLADKFKEALQVIPGIDIEFTQPIEMRFNELITGVRADIAIKIFGEDLNLLNTKANEIKNVIKDIEGASDVVVEKVVGLPQINIKYNREKIGLYGLTIKEINRMIGMGFSGEYAGEIYEGEKKFDLVMRFDQETRNNLETIKNIQVSTQNGLLIPLRELADIKLTEGPAKISRDETKRRIVVGVNVRNRDLQSVVNEIQEMIENHVKLPPGYHITYGGQFENLQQAKDRLAFALPVALFLIFMMLYFAFKSLKDTLIIFSAIPLAAVGGVFSLWIRGMPFSISAGIGFIALFGIAVLNGIVLIKHFKEMNLKNDENLFQMIQKGTQERMRPVLLTASAAALGFLPMAISSNVGAEVQRPLATVVIGGLVSSTFLTLVVLPVFYVRFFDSKTKTNLKNKALLLIFLLFNYMGFSQIPSPTLTELQQKAIENNAALKSSYFKVQQKKVSVQKAYQFDKTNIYYAFDENNLALNELPLKVFGIQQDIRFPGLYFNAKKLFKTEYEISEIQYAIEKRKILGEVAKAYEEVLYYKNIAFDLKKLDSLYADFSKKANRRFELGETNYLEKINAQAQQKKIEIALNEALNNINNAMLKLQAIVQSEEPITVPFEKLYAITIDQNKLFYNYVNEVFDLRNKMVELKISEQKQNFFPDLSLEYFMGTNEYINEHLQGFQIGLKIPILFGGNAAQLNASKVEKDIAEQERIEFVKKYESKYAIHQKDLEKYLAYLDYYEKEGSDLSKALIKTANRSYLTGEIDYFDYIKSLENATQIEISYLDHLHQYNQIILNLQYFNF
ncbi:CusA/CzcA family heavy metal efflux RND transporter [Namhaeicola litoreus]|uniref:CusA/CzcA family heavy metal efflux RND transporter n=1 Tax=Namhaeicola litoreus TaxID=1052145 RepID=A0ABW3Y310_9FLAO